MRQYEYTFKYNFDAKIEIFIIYETFFRKNKLFDFTQIKKHVERN